MRRPDDLADLERLSARLGVDPLLIQAAGGNTSVKEGAAMWIKASGTLLAEALAREIFVPVDLAAIRAAMAAGDASSDRPAAFALGGGGLRPSIETSLHAVFPQRVVIHVHSVDTLALVVRADARERLGERLAGFDWVFVPYVKPGARLAGAVRAALGPATNVVVLGNHGLVVAGASVAAAERLLARVSQALKTEPAPFAAPDAAALAALGGDAYAPAPADHPLHGVALSPARLKIATGGSLFPDYIVFCGVGAIALAAGETAAAAAARQAARGFAPPVFVLAAGKGALLRADASPAALALARCLGDVLMRLPQDARPVYLSDADNAEILDWDAEKYRLALNVG